MNRHSPPNSSTCTRGSLNVERDVYTSGRPTASTNSPATPHHTPHSRPTSPANESTAQPPRTAGMSSAPLEPAKPRPAREDQRQPGQERRRDRAARHGEPRGREVQPLGPAERRSRLGDPRRPVLGDPVPVLQVDAGVAGHEDLLGPEDRLPHPEPGRDREHGEQRDGGRVRLRPGGGAGGLRLGFAEPRPAHRQPPHREVAQRDRERGEDDHHRHGPQPPGEQHPGPRQQPRHGEQRRRHRDRGEGPAGHPHSQRRGRGEPGGQGAPGGRLGLLVVRAPMHGGQR